MKSAQSSLIQRTEKGESPSLGQRRGGSEPRQTNKSPYPVCDYLTEEMSFIAASLPMIQIRRQVLQIAAVDVPVFISGESGVGKEVIAHVIHANSPRRARPFIKVNCAAIPGELLESELFGYEQGAFTGAVRSKPGRFELAHHGTIFLDEIGEISPHLQAKLLQVLQDNQFTRLGGGRMVDVDIRVVAASNVNVPEAIRTGRLRSDLYYRLNVLAVHVPPLRERRIEIPLFLCYFLEKYCKEFQKELPRPSRQLVDAATRYSWPGNLRELENFVKRYVILGEGSESLQELAELSGRETALLPKKTGLKERLRALKQEVEREAIADILKRTHWCRKQTAEVLGISYKALLYKIRQFHLDESPYDKPAPPLTFPTTAMGTPDPETLPAREEQEEADEYAAGAEPVALGARSRKAQKPLSMVR